MKIAFNPSTVAALTSPPDNKDITFDLRGRNIFARGVKFYGTDTWRPVVDNLTSNSATSSLSANQGRVLAGLINGKSDSDHNHDGRYLKLTGGTLTGNLVGTSAMFSGRFYGNGDDEGIIIKPSSNGYAGLILGAHDGERSIFYFVKNKPFWRYSHGSDNLDIIHPKKSGTIALTSDIPSSVKNPYSLTTFGVVYDGSAEKVVSPSNFISQLEEGTSVVTDGTMFVTSYASDKGFADTNAVNVPYKRKAARLWDYIKAKTDSLYATKNHNHDDRYLKLTGGVLKGQIILPDIDVNTSYTGSIIIGASNTENLGIDGNEIMARNNGKASTLYLNNEGGAVQLGAVLRTSSNIAYIGSQSTQDMIKFINNTSDSYGNGIAIGGGGLTIIGSGESSDVVMGQHSSGGDENMIIAGDGNIDFYSNLQSGWKYGKHMYLDTNGFLFTPSYINIGGNENNNSSPDRVWGSNGSDSYLRSYRTSALNVANADTVDGYHYDAFTYKRHIGYNRNGPYNIKVFSMDTSSLTWGAYYLIFDIFSSGYSNNRVYFGRYEVSLGHWNNTDKNPTVYSRWIFKTNSAYDCVHVVKDLSSYKVDVYIENNLWDCSMGLSIVAIDGFKMVSSNSWVNLPSASSTVQLIGTTYLSFIGNATSATKVIVNQHTTNDTNYPLVWSNQTNTSNVTENQLYKSWADLYYNPKNKRLTVGGSVVTSSFIKSSGTSQQLLRADGGVAAFNWSGQAGQPTWLWGGNSEHSYYVYNPSNFRVAYASSAGNAETLDGYHANGSNVAPYGHIPTIESDGVMEVGKYIDFHNDNSGEHDFSTRLQSTGNYGNMVNLPSASGTLALISDNVASATNAYHLRINSANTWSTWYWAGQSGQPSWLWGSNDGINMYVWNPNNFNVNTAQYLRSLGNQNCQIGRTQAYGDVYTYNTYNNTGSPTAYTSVIGFGRGIGGTVEIAGGWCDTNLYWRSLRDCCEDWYSWRTVLDSDNYTDFINNYYWANVKISTSANTQTQPSVNTIYASNWFRSQGTSGWYSESYGGGIWMNDSSWIRTYGGKSFYCDNQIYSSNSIRMSNILLEHTDEINNNANGGIHLNYRNSGNVSLCQGGGKVGIGTTTPAYKLDVKGQVKASGFIHSDHSINDAVLLAGGGYERIFMLGTTRYYNNTSYELSFHKLSGLCNNLVWVDGCIWNSTSISFQLSSDFYPYFYANSPSMRTIYRMDGNNMITVDGNGIVIISCSSYPRRVGFFYTGRA